MSPYLAVSSIVLAMMLMAVGNGLMGTFVPIRLSALGMAPETVGAVVTAYAVGLLAGCTLAGWTVRRVGHIRSYAAFASITALCALALSGVEDTVAWLVLRGLQGFASNAVFMIAQSWLNELTTSEHRGRVMAFFYVSFTASMAVGTLLLTGLDVHGSAPFMIPAWTYVLSVVVVALTRMQSPPPPRQVRIEPLHVYRVSPVGLVGVFVSGMIGMTFQGVGALYGATIGLAAPAIAVMMAAAQAGNLVVQWPLGWFSDRVDRRYALLAAIAVVSVSSAGLIAGGAASFVTLVVLVAALAGAGESLYSIATAQANDHAREGEYVMISSTGLVAWSLGATVGPIAATGAISALGPNGLFSYFLAVALPFAVFVAWRRRVRAPAPENMQQQFLAHPSTNPLGAEWTAEQEQSDAQPRPRDTGAEDQAQP